MTKTSLSVVIITKNEERNIEDCLKSVSWAAECIVVDDESTDRTVDIAKRLGAKVFHRKMDNEGKHRNWAYAQATNEWILSLDADERVMDELRDEIIATIPNAEHPTYTIPRRNYIGDYWVKYGGQYPAAQRRLFKKGYFSYEEVGVHPRAFVKGEHKGHLTKDMIHYSYRDIEHFVRKLNGQTTLEAHKWIQTNRKVTFGRALWRTIDRFFRAYVRKKGYKDGLIGFMFALFGSFYQMASYSKYWEIKKGNVVGTVGLPPAHASTESHQGEVREQSTA